MSTQVTSPQVASPDVSLEALAEASDHLENATAQEILRWSVEQYYPKLAMATAFGPEGCCLLHMLAEIERRVYVFNLDTGYQFKETIELRDRIARRYGIEVELIRPELTVPEYEAAHGGPVYSSNPDQCCQDRKIAPLKKAIVGYRAWISAIRRDQSSFRRNAGVVQWDKKFSLVKVNPLARWTREQVWEFIRAHDIPYNPLHDQGFPSIGCWPCTRAVMTGEDDRAGRWSGTEKTECGLHLGGDDGAAGKAGGQ